jgi:broad specificity phosphatase PhoE
MNLRHASVLFVVAALGLFFVMRSATDLGARDMSGMPSGTSQAQSYIQYTAIKGYFLQSEADTDASKFDFKKQNFGLIDRSYDTDAEPDHGDKSQWQRFESYVRQLNEQSGQETWFKVLFLARHGQGWHNVAESKYGTPAWDCHWSMLDGADGIIWADANLTELGIGQAREVHKLWQSLLGGIPSPDAYYVSPLARAIQTADITFNSLDLPHDKSYKPVVKELLREAIGVHTCDRRQSATALKKLFPHVVFEHGFAEDDPLWTAEYREPRSARRLRMTELLDDIFSADEGTFLSFTSHSGAIASILEAISHRQFDLETGGVIPVLVKAERVRGEREEPPSEPSGTPPACAVNPTALLN